MKAEISKERNSSFELLRLILMFLIVVHHCIAHGLSLAGLGETWAEPCVVKHHDMPLFMYANAFCICAVNVFILITGYFGIHLSLSKISKLLFHIFFYSIISSIGYYILIDHNYSKLIKGFLAISNSPYWFVRNYLILMCLSPMINNFFRDYNKKQVQSFLVLLLFISCYLGFLWKYNTNVNGYSLFQFVMMYCIGRYIRLYHISLNIKKSLPLYCLFSVAIGTIMYVMYLSGTEKIWKITYYNNPLVMLSAIYLFLTFQALHFKSALINRISASALSVYLVQSSTLGEHYLYRFIKSIYTGKCSIQLGGGKIMLFIVVISLLVIMISLIIDSIPQKIYSIIERCKFKK